MAFTGNWACNTFKTGMMNGTFNFTSGSFKIALYTNAAALDATTTAYTSTGEVVASGYTAGGLALTIAQVPTVGNSGTTAYISFNNAVWTSALTARGALIYQTTTGNPAVCVLDFGADKSSSTTFTVQFPNPSNTSAIIRIA
jgi:O-acetylhomoserine/O-acetylserine sulfhydrylase-like pyridoxal-dependent enzyme